MKSPYLTAFEKYHSREVEIPWTEALDFHFQNGVVLSTDTFFVMARPVHEGIPELPQDQLCLHYAYPTRFLPVWHIWMAAGDLLEMAQAAQLFGIQTLTFLRRGGRLHRLEVASLESRAWSQNARLSKWQL